MCTIVNTMANIHNLPLHSCYKIEKKMLEKITVYGFRLHELQGHISSVLKRKHYLKLPTHRWNITSFISEVNLLFSVEQIENYTSWGVVGLLIY